LIFNDLEIYEKILAAKHPKQIKSLGRPVPYASTCFISHHFTLIGRNGEGLNGGFFAIDYTRS
jgi:hypothetical protein